MPVTKPLPEGWSATDVAAVRKQAEVAAERSHRQHLADEAERLALAAEDAKRPSRSPNRYMTGGGTATFSTPSNEPPLYVLRAIRGATKLRQTWLDANEAGREVFQAQRAASAELSAYRKTDPVSVDLERAERAFKSGPEAATAAAERTARRALAAYDDAVTPRLQDPDIRSLMAKHALEQQDRAEAALEELAAAVRDRNETAWQAGLAIGNSVGGYTFDHATETLKGELARLDRRAVTAVIEAEGAQ